MPHNGLKHIISFLEKETGFLFDDSGKEKLSSLVNHRMDLVKTDSSERYLTYIRSPKGSGELANLIGCLTVAETHFLRNREHWRALKEFVLPGIIDSKSTHGRTIKIWSAGCSTGEEPYTIAISLLEGLSFPETWDIKIIATDINERSLMTAREGLYTKNSFRGVEDQWIEKYFVKKKGRYRIKEKIRKMVEFERLNLASETTFPPENKEMDVIFCRNLLMYLRPEVNTEIVHKFKKSLKKDGFLFLGHAEGSIIPKNVFKYISCCNTFIFQKKADCGSRVASFGMGLNKNGTVQMKHTSPKKKKVNRNPTIEPKNQVDPRSIEFATQKPTSGNQLWQST